MSRLAFAAALVTLTAGCATPVHKDLSKFVAARPRSVLVVPVVNKSVDVTASDYFLSTVAVPIAERGYYVFPTNLVKRTLEDDGLSDSVLVHSADPARLGTLFGADAILYVTIERWDAKYVVITTNVTVDLVYTLKDAKTGTTIWSDHQIATYSTDSGNAGVIGALVNAAIAKAAPNYMPLAKRANATAVAYPGPGFPAGPYRLEHGTDYQPGLAPAPATPAQ
jgi:hypothetical protein